MAAERNLPREIVLSAIEAALISAYKRDSVAAGQDISVKLDPNTGDVSVFTIRTVAEEIEDPDIQSQPRRRQEDTGGSRDWGLGPYGGVAPQRGPHSRADGQAGRHPTVARGRAGPRVPRIRRQGRRGLHSHGAAYGAQADHRRAWQGGGYSALVRAGAVRALQGRLQDQSAPQDGPGVGQGAGDDRLARRQGPG